MYRSGYNPGQGTSVPELELSTGPRSGAVCKRGVDIAVASLFFLLFGWLFLACWVLAIAKQGAPAIYRHRRIGRNGVEFDCLKFRSMALDGDQILANHLLGSPEAKAEWERDFKLRNDPRVTTFGRFLRKTSLDELPQFWNVLKGEMSIVGPRPVIAEELARYYGSAAAEYIRVKPGITGPWQISGRHEHSYEERVAWDCAYVRDWSVVSDFLIMLRTALVVVSRKGSY